MRKTSTAAARTAGNLGATDGLSHGQRVAHSKVLVAPHKDVMWQGLKDNDDISGALASLVVMHAAIVQLSTRPEKSTARPSTHQPLSQHNSQRTRTSP